MSSILFHSYFGLGDNVYMRPFVLGALKKYSTVDIKTPFPDFLYSGTPVRCLKPQTELKTQKEYIEKTKFPWKLPLGGYNKKLKLNYSAGFHKGQNILETLQEQSGIVPESFQFDIPQPYKAKAKRLVKTNKPICFLRLPTIRKEWVASSRNAPMQYFQYVINQLKDTHYIVSCLDLRNGAEWLDGELPTGIDLCLHNAELDVNGMLGLMAISDCLIGIQSNLIPLSCALQKPCFIIYHLDCAFRTIRYAVAASIT